MRSAEDRFDDALLRVLCAHREAQPLWLGFVEKRASNVVFDDAPRVQMYAEWNDVLVQASRKRVRTWRSDERRWFTALPKLRARRIAAGSCRVSVMTHGQMSGVRPS